MNYRLFTLTAFLILAACSIGEHQAAHHSTQEPSAPPPTVYYVSPSGDDAWSGRLAVPPIKKSDNGPFLTLNRAFEEVKSLDPWPAAGVTIALLEGDHRFETSAHLQDLNAPPQSPLVIRPHRNDRVRILGGKPVSFSSLTDPSTLDRLPPASRPHVVQIDLAPLHITHYGSLAYDWAQVGNPYPIELFYDHEPMQLARWPNDAWLLILETPDGERGATVVYENPPAGPPTRPWADPSQAVAQGYYRWMWADAAQPVAAFQPAQRRAEFTATHEPYGIAPGGRFFFKNVLEELDQPGDYVIDPAAHTIYFWPPDHTHDHAWISICTDPLIRLTRCANVHIEGIELAYTRGSALVLKDSSDCLLAGCTIANLSGDGIVIEGGRRILVQSCDIFNGGACGIRVTAGNRQTLERADHVLDNNYIHTVSRLRRTYFPALSLNGVGLTATHNWIHSLPHSAIIWSGNDMHFDANEIHHVLYECKDCGAMYSGRDWTMRGNVIQNSYIHDLPIREQIHGVYLDDQFSSADVRRNLFVEMQNAVFIGGGRDNTVANNIFVACNQGVLVDDRGLYFEPIRQTLRDRLHEVHHDAPPYSQRWPELASILQDDPDLPKGNRIFHNVADQATDFLVSPDYLLEKKILHVHDNLAQRPPGFVDPAARDFRLRPDSPAFELGFQPLAYDDWGLYPDPYRRPLPSRPDRAQLDQLLHSWPTRPAPADEPLYPCPPAPTPITVDGDLSDWGELPLLVDTPAQISGDETIWSGPQDCRFAFATRYDATHIYFAVRVWDDVVLENTRVPAWFEDGVELRFDARPKPVRDQWRGLSENLRTLTIILSPGETLSNSDYDHSRIAGVTQAVCVPAPGGYRFEASIDADYANRLQDGPWQGFRMNVAVNDRDDRTEPIQQLSWKPDWRRELNYPGSGSFTRAPANPQ